MIERGDSTTVSERLSGLSLRNDREKTKCDCVRETEWSESEKFWERTKPDCVRETEWSES